LVITGFNGGTITLETLQAYKNERVKVGEDDDGKTVYLRMKYFLKYLKKRNGASKDDSPLYIFDANFGKRIEPNSGLSKDKEFDGSSQALCHLSEVYKVPKFFRDDLLRVTKSRRPPFRWIVIGSARSGTGVHIVCPSNSRTRSELRHGTM
jgi:histone arginine demethylase JMJD6